MPTRRLPSPPEPQKVCAPLFSASLILEEARETGVDGIVTTCPSCRVHLNQQDGGMRTYDPLELLLD